MAKVSHMVTTFIKTADDNSPMKGALIGGLGGGVIGGLANMKARRDIEDKYKTPHHTSNSTNFMLGGLLGGLGGAGAGYLAGGGAKNLLANNDQVQYLTKNGPAAISGKAINALADSEQAIEGSGLDQLASSMSERRTHPLSMLAGATGVAGAAALGHGPLAHARRIVSGTRGNLNSKDINNLMSGKTNRTFGTGLSPDEVKKLKFENPELGNFLYGLVDSAVAKPTPNANGNISPGDFDTWIEAMKSNVGKVNKAVRGEGDVFPKDDELGSLLTKDTNKAEIDKMQRSALNRGILSNSKQRLIPSALGAANIYQGGQLLGNLREWLRLRKERQQLQG